MVIDQPQGGLEVIRAHHRQYRAEDFFFIDTHVRLDVVEQAAAQEVPVFIALKVQPPTVDDQVGAFLDAQIDVGLYLLEMLLGDQRAHLAVRIHARPDLQRANLRL